MRARFAGIAALALSPLLPPASTPVSAHLCIVRQGVESRGAVEAGDRHGQIVAAGDFNGDGIDDLATGVPYEDLTGGLTDAGAVIVNWGQTYGITHESALLLTEASLGGASQANAEFGYALAAADYNGDGYDDLAVGIPGADLGGADIGKVWMLRGTPTGLVTWFLLQQPNGGGANEAGDRFGASLCAGNFDGDSGPIHWDLAVGAPGEDGNAGAVFWFLSNAGGPTGASGWFKQSTLGESSNAGDQFGFSLASGDLVWSSEHDLAVGAPYKDRGFTDTGLIYVIRGSASGLTAASVSVHDTRDFGTLETGSNFGFSLAAGRLAGAGAYADLAVGEPGRSFQGIGDVGRVVVLPGDLFGLDVADAIVLDQWMANGAPNAGDRWGWALAAGELDQPDGYDELAVGAPHDAIGGFADAGIVHVFYGGPNGPQPLVDGFAGFNQGTLNDPVEGGEELGASLAFGAFDATGRGGLAAGATGEDGAAGQVHVILPWRQVYELMCRNSAVYDCNGALVFSQKPFDEIYIASTTKIMTTLLACERSQLPPSDPDWVDLNAVHAIPDWIVGEVGGTNVLEPNEVMSLRELLYTNMLVSANDAAYMVGGILAGDLTPNGIPAFAAQMNARAAQIGMTRTHFNNAAGFENDRIGPAPADDNHSSAEDMAMLGRTAMMNPLLAQIAGTSSRTIVRHTTSPAESWAWTAKSIIMSWVHEPDSFPWGDGVKSGSTPLAQLTAVVSAEPPLGFGHAIATTFGSPKDTLLLDRDIVHENAIDLLGLGLGDCGFSFDFRPPADFRFEIDASTVAGVLSAGAAEFGGHFADDVTFDFCRLDGTGATSAEVEIRRVSRQVLSPFGSDAFGIGPFEEHRGIRLQNLGAQTVSVRVTPDYGAAVTFSLAPGEVDSLPAYTGAASDVSFTIQNLSLVGADISLEETYRFPSVQFPPGPCVGQQFTAVVPRTGRAVDDLFEVRVLGTDPVNGSTIGVFGHPGTTTAVDVPALPPLAPSGPLLAGLAAIPNPVPPGAGTRLQFTLREAGRIAATLYDVAGRRVRELPAARLEPGVRAVRWDGRDGSGSPVAGGVYFYRVRLDDREAASGRVTVLR